MNIVNSCLSIILGRTFTLTSSNLTDINAPAIKGGLAGQFTRESGFLSFFEVIIHIYIDDNDNY